jgi:katanin p60 ATPase-containing subunit A1
MCLFFFPSVFMDEVDGLCSARGGSGEHEASRRVKGEILAQMDGASSSSEEYDPARSVIVLGATNLPWELDSAFLRRFEKRIHIDLPDAEGRADMFRINTDGMAVADEVREDDTWATVVGLSDGYSGADIATCCKDASMLGLRRLLAGKKVEEIKAMAQSELAQEAITLADFESVFQTVKSTAGKADLEKYKTWSDEYGSSL